LLGIYIFYFIVNIDSVNGHSLIYYIGLRWACLLTALVIFLGASVRCLTPRPSYLKVTAGIGQFLNGIGAPVAVGVPPVLSAKWFPPHQRTLATAIASMLNIAGVAASFVIGTVKPVTVVV